MPDFNDTAIVSGVVASCNDAADDVELKSCVCGIVASGGGGTPSSPVPIVGYSGMNVVRCGKNRIQVSDFEQGSINSSGVDIDSTSRLRSVFIPVISGVPYSFSVTGTDMQVYFVFEYTAKKTHIRRTSVDNTSGSITLGATTSYFRLLLRKTNNANLTPSDITTIQLEQASSPTTYETFNGDTYAISWSDHGTVYGGELNVTTGVLSVTWGILSLSVSDMNNTNENYPGWRGCGIKTLIGSDKGSIAVGDFLVNVGNGLGVNTNGSNDICFLPYSSYGLTQTEWKTTYPDLVVKIAVKLATPQTYQLTPTQINTLLGTNNIYCDTNGTTTVEYYKSGYGTTSITIHRETPNGDPVVKTTKLHKVIYCGLVDVVKGKAEPKNLAELSNADNANRSSFSYTTEKPELIEWTKTGSGGKFYARFILHIPKPGKYTISCTNDSTLKAKYIYSDELWGTAVYSSVSQNPFVAEFSASGDYVMGFYAGSSATSGTLGEVMCEEGETQTSYAPYFAPFSFTPISMDTEAGENTLYADEGDSAIIYRKEST